MEVLVFILAAVVFIVLLFKKIGSEFNKEISGIGHKLSRATPQYPYKKKTYLLSIAEKNFFDALLPIAEENDFLIFSKVRLEDLLYLPSGTAQRLKYRGYVRSRHADFVICDKFCRPLAVIELDDSSHYKEERHEIDSRINQIFREVGLPVFRFKVHSAYNQESLRGVLRSLKTNQTNA